MLCDNIKKTLVAFMAVAAFCATLSFSALAQAQSSKHSPEKGTATLKDDTATPKNGTATPRGGWNIPLSKEENAEIKGLRDQLKVKAAALREVFSAPKLDEAKAKAIHSEIEELTGKMSQKRFNAAVAYKKANPSWKPGDNRENKKAKKSKMKGSVEKPAAAQ